ncbi:MAG: AAA family ATPase [Elusimicrobia bacterium]|nr:AAA family ATPase [Elusimicrobiota bacterium]
MLKKLEVRNFKSLDGVKFEFDTINLFVGPNSSGKSTALQAIEMLPALLRPSITDFLKDEKGWDYRDLPHRQNQRSTMSWKAEYHLRGGVGEEPTVYQYEFELQPKLHLGIGKEMLYMTKPGAERQVLIDRTGRQTKIWNDKAKKYRKQSLYNLPCSAMQALESGGGFSSVIRFRDYLIQFQSFLLWNPKDLRRPHQGLAERLGPSGEQMPGFWAYLNRKEPQKAKELLAMLQRIFPRLEAVKSTGKPGWAWHHLAISERIGDDLIEYPAEQASDGFLRMLAVFSLKHFPNPPRIITLEEPEDGVHPQLISNVLEHLRSLADRKEPAKIQVFMTSHSPYVLNEFAERPECVHIFEKGRRDAVPKIIPLIERRQVLSAAAGLNRSLGDLWYSGMLGGGAR